MSKRKKSIQLKLFRSTLLLCRAILKLITKFLKFSIVEILIHLLFGSMILGLAYIFVSWGVSSTIAFYMAVLTLGIVCILLVAISIILDSSTKHTQSNIRIRIATWLAQNFVNRASIEWTEYQDWLHDIFLARRQLLDAKCPRWKVTIITYWRLSTFLVIVSLSKIKSLAVSVMRFR